VQGEQEAHVVARRERERERECVCERESERERWSGRGSVVVDGEWRWLVSKRRAKVLDQPGIDPGTSRMRSERSAM
jgi:hypothetical protein